MRTLRNIFIIISLLWAGIAYAQAPDPVQYILAPETPGPASPVEIAVQGVGSFLGDATITWSLNGKVMQSGVGLTTFSFTTGALGTQSVVRISINSSTQGLISKTITFSPSVINLLWESDTTVPPLYAGKALYSPGAPLRITAFPTVIIAGKRVAASSLSYQWSVNDEPLPASSGSGKNTLSYDGNGLNSAEQVSVDVYFGSSKVGHGEITVVAAQPQLILYNKDPLRGIVWEQALPAQGVALNGKEITIAAQPYYFSTAALRQQALTWTWALDGVEVSGPFSNQGVLTLRQTGTGQGEAQLQVSLQNNNSSELLQSAQTALHLVFGSQQNSLLSSFFGL